MRPGCCVKSVGLVIRWFRVSDAALLLLAVVSRQPRVVLEIPRPCFFNNQLAYLLPVRFLSVLFLTPATSTLYQISLAVRVGSLFGLTQGSYSFELFKFHDLLSFKTILVYGIVLHNPVQQIVPWVPEVFSRAAGIFGVGRRPTHLRP